MEKYLFYFNVFVFFTLTLLCTLYAFKIILRIAFCRENRLLSFGLLVLFVSSMLGFFEPWYLDVYFNDVSQVWVSKVDHLIWWLGLTIVISQSIDLLLWRGIFSTDGNLTVPKILVDIISLSIYIIIGMAILHFVFEQPIIAFAATSGVMALILGYSAQNTLADIFAGMSLNLKKSFNKGDWIKVDGDLGKVVDMNWRFVELETIHKNSLTIPNNVVNQSKIHNYFMPCRYRAESFMLHIEHDVSPQMAKQLILKAAGDCPLILSSPAAEVCIHEYIASGVMYQLWYYTEQPDDLYIKDQVFSSLWYMLKNDNYRISLAEVCVYYPEAESSGDIEKTKRAIKRIEIFNVLHDDEIAYLAQRAKALSVGSPQKIIQQGDVGTSMFIVESGRLEVFVHQHGQDVKVGVIDAGAFIGEMSLLTGEPRSATVRVASDSILYEIQKQDIVVLFEQRRALVEEISKVVAHRNMEMKAAKSNNIDNIDAIEERGMANKIGARIQKFFSLPV